MKAKIAALALITGSAFFSTDVFAIGNGWVAGPERHMKCYNGKFSGEVKFKIHKNDKYPYRIFKLTEYRIKRHNGQRGGNKANINLTAFSSPRGYGRTEYSPDRMKQEGNWLPYGATTTVYPGSHSRVNVRYIFDKSGWDPSCTVDYYLGPTE